MTMKKYCRYCGCTCVERYNYGPLSYHFCGDTHEAWFWFYWCNDLMLFKWIRAHPFDRGPHLIDMTPTEITHNSKVLKVLSRHGPPHRHQRHKRNFSNLEVQDDDSIQCLPDKRPNGLAGELNATSAERRKPVLVPGTQS